MSPHPSNSRMLLWVDAVGGYLVCLGDRIAIGQAVPHTNVELPILGDLSGHHATICREGESYLVEPHGPVRVEGRAIDRPTLLTDGDELQFGRSVRMRFRQPHALSATARLDFLSRHRTQPAADGVLLMGESIVLGPNLNNHVVCRNWPGDVILFREGDELFCRAGEAFEIDGRLCTGRGPLARNSRVSGEEFALSLEEF